MNARFRGEEAPHASGGSVAEQAARAAPVALRVVQQRFQQHMLGHGDASELLAGSAERRMRGLDIYANAYRRRLVEALTDAYAKTCAWLGAEAFDRVALKYIEQHEQHPPHTRNLRWYAAHLAEHLPADLPQRAAVRELVQLEWALRGAFDGPDSAVLDSRCLSEIPPRDWADLRWRPVPTAQLLPFNFNTVAVWQALDDEHAAPPSERGPSAVYWLVWRKALQPHFRSLSAAEAGLLQAQLEGTCFAQACVQAQAQFDGLDAEQIGAHLRQWLDDGVLAARDTAAHPGD